MFNIDYSLNKGLAISDKSSATARLRTVDTAYVGLGIAGTVGIIAMLSASEFHIISNIIAGIILITAYLTGLFALWHEAPGIRSKLSGHDVVISADDMLSPHQRELNDINEELIRLEVRRDEYLDRNNEQLAHMFDFQIDYLNERRQDVIDADFASKWVDYTLEDLKNDLRVAQKDPIADAEVQDLLSALLYLKRNPGSPEKNAEHHQKLVKELKTTLLNWKAHTSEEYYAALASENTEQDMINDVLVTQTLSRPYMYTSNNEAYHLG